MSTLTADQAPAEALGSDPLTHRSRGRQVRNAMATVGVTLCFLLAIGAGIWATQVRYYSRYTHNVTRWAQQLQGILDQYDFAASAQSHKQLEN